MIVWVGGGHNSLYNFEGLTHLALPFMFGLTICGLRVIRRGRLAHKTRARDYGKCKRCFH